MAEKRFSYAVDVAMLHHHPIFFSSHVRVGFHLVAITTMPTNKGVHSAKVDSLSSLKLLGQAGTFDLKTKKDRLGRSLPPTAAANWTHFSGG